MSRGRASFCCVASPRCFSPASSSPRRLFSYYCIDARSLHTVLQPCVSVRVCANMCCSASLHHSCRGAPPHRTDARACISSRRPLSALLNFHTHLTFMRAHIHTDLFSWADHRTLFPFLGSASPRTPPLPLLLLLRACIARTHPPHFTIPLLPAVLSRRGLTIVVCVSCLSLFLSLPCTVTGFTHPFLTLPPPPSGRSCTGDGSSSSRSRRFATASPTICLFHRPPHCPNTRMTLTHAAFFSP